MQTSINFDIVQTFVILKCGQIFRSAEYVGMLSWRIVKAVRFRRDKEVGQFSSRVDENEIILPNNFDCAGVEMLCRWQVFKPFSLFLRKFKTRLGPGIIY